MYCKHNHLIDGNNDRGEKYKELSNRCKLCYCLTKKKSSDKYNNSEKGKENVLKRKESGNLVNSWLKNEYNISFEQYLVLIMTQCNSCLICGRLFDKEIICCIDHDHIRNNVRGLLCKDCNTGLGLFKENPEIINNAIKYLDSNND